MKEVRLYHSPLTCSLASEMALVLGEIPHEVAIVRTDLSENQLPPYLAINPLGKVPVLSVDGTSLTESAAILPLIADLSSATRLMPEEQMARAKARSLLSYMSSTLHPAWTSVLRPERFTTGQHADGVREAALGRLIEAFGFLEDRLGEREYLLGELTVCDLYLAVFLMWRQAALTANDQLPQTPYLDSLQTRIFSAPKLGAALKQDMALRGLG